MDGFICNRVKDNVIEANNMFTLSVVSHNDFFIELEEALSEIMEEINREAMCGKVEAFYLFSNWQRELNIIVREQLHKTGGKTFEQRYNEFMCIFKYLIMVLTQKGYHIKYIPNFPFIIYINWDTNQMN